MPVAQKTRNNKTSPSLQYDPLEPRQMLVGDICDVIFAADFEDVEVAPGNFEHVESISGFAATNAAVEVQHDVPIVGPASSGDQHLELDGTNGISVTLSDRVNDGLLLRFDFSPRPGVGAQQNTVEIWYNGELLNSVTDDGSRNNTTEFRSVEFGLPAVSSASADLEFRSNSPDDNVGLGGLIDNVQVLATSSIPGLNPLEDQELAVGESLSVAASLDATTDDSVTYSIVNGPEGLTIDPQTGEITWVANQEAVDSSNADNVVLGFEDPVEEFQAGFESADLPPGTFDFFTEVDGFQSIHGRGVEVQREVASVGPASEGSRLLELDGTNGIFRDVDTSEGGQFQLELDFSPRPGVAANLNDVQVWWDGELIETVVGNGEGLVTTAFSRRLIDLPVPTSDSTRLELRSNSAPVGLGGLVDNIVLNRSAQTESAGELNKFQVVVQATIGDQIANTDFLICLTETVPEIELNDNLTGLSAQKMEERLMGMERFRQWTAPRYW